MPVPDAVVGVANGPAFAMFQVLHLSLVPEAARQAQNTNQEVQIRRAVPSRTSANGKHGIRHLSSVLRRCDDMPAYQCFSCAGLPMMLWAAHIHHRQDVQKQQELSHPLNGSIHCNLI